MSTEVQALRMAIGLHQAGQLSQAEQAYRQILESSPWDADALHLLGVVALQTRRHELAIQYISAALVASPAQSNYYNSLGKALQAVGSLSEAQTCYERAIELAPDHALAHNNLGNVLRAQGKPEESLAEFRKTLACEPNTVEALSNLGVALASLERFDEAIEHLENAARLDKQSAEAHSNLGCAYSAAKNWERAIQCFNEALRLAPDFVDARRHLAGALQAKGDTAAAVAVFAEAIRRHPGHVETLLNYGSLLESQGRVEESLELAQRALRVKPDSADARFHRARALQALHRFDEAKQEFRDAIRRQPDVSQTPTDVLMFCLNASHEYKCLFVHIPKNGGTSIKRALDMPGGGHPLWREYATQFPRLWQQYTSFAVVRNPWDRAVSAYHHARMKVTPWHNEQRGFHPDYPLLLNKSFEECVTILCHERQRLVHESWLDQSLFVIDGESPDKRIMVDTVLRFETLAEDFAEFCRKLDIPCADLPTVNSSPRSRDYRSYYNDQTRKMVEQVYRADIETFGYAF